MARRKLSHEGTLVLDCEGLSKFVSDHEPVVALVAEARRRGMEVVISALTVIEAVHRRTEKARLAWVLPGVRIVHIGDEEAKAASAMLIDTGLHGHKGEKPTEADNVEGPPVSRGPFDIVPGEALAEDTRFELVRGCPQHAFQACALGL